MKFVTDMLQMTIQNYRQLLDILEDFLWTAEKCRANADVVLNYAHNEEIQLCIMNLFADIDQTKELRPQLENLCVMLEHMLEMLESTDSIAASLGDYSFDRRPAKSKLDVRKDDDDISLCEIGTPVDNQIYDSFDSCQSGAMELEREASFWESDWAESIPDPAHCPPLACPLPLEGIAIEEDVPQLEISKVHFSALAPKKLTKGEYSMIDVVMYEDSCRKVVEEMIAEAEEPVKETRSGLFAVEKEATVRIVLTSPDVDIEDNEEAAVWQGEYLHFSFAVEIPEDYAKRQVLFIATVYINDLIATRLKFVAKSWSLKEQKLEIIREDVLSAFVSYASQDRHRVATLIQGMKKARPDMDIFFDVESLRSREDWEQTLTTEIERRDILFLCWSTFARQSKWVETEWRYALRCKGLECIEPIPIDPPTVCPPPDELKNKHFNDRMLYIINSK